MNITKIITIIPSLACVLLTSGCTGQYPNPIVPGNYIYKSDDESETRYLSIRSITQEEFVAANGKNVVEDVSKQKTNSYYLLDCYLLEEDSKKTTLDFINLKYAPEKALVPYKSLSYFDDNGYLIRSLDGSNFDVYINRLVDEKITESYIFYYQKNS